MVVYERVENIWLGVQTSKLKKEKALFGANYRGILSAAMQGNLNFNPGQEEEISVYLQR